MLDQLGGLIIISMMIFLAIIKISNSCLIYLDWEATNEAIEEQVARESYLQWLRDNERRNSGSVSIQEPRNIGNKALNSW